MFDRIGFVEEVARATAVDALTMFLLAFFFACLAYYVYSFACNVLFRKR
jgi:hypothetical protein